MIDKNTCGEDLAVIASAIAIALAKNLDVDELITMNFLIEAIATNLDLIASQRLKIAQRNNNSTTEILL